MTEAISKALIRGLDPMDIVVNVAYMPGFVILCIAAAYAARKTHSIFLLN